MVPKPPNNQPHTPQTHNPRTTPTPTPTRPTINNQLEAESNSQVQLLLSHSLLANRIS